MTKIIFNSIISRGRNFVRSDKFVLLISSVFEITQNHIVIVFKVIGRKHVCKISQFFTGLHKINESNAKVLTDYCIVCLYSKNVSYYVFIPDKFFRNMSSGKSLQEHVPHQHYRNKQFHFCYKIKQSNVFLHLHVYQGLLRMPHPLFL